MRFWRIYLIDDQYPEIYAKIKENLLNLPENTLKELHGLDIIFFNSLGDLGKTDDLWQTRDSFPVLVQTVTQSWITLKALKDKNSPPDIIIIDVKLTALEDKSTDLEKIKYDLLSYFSFSTDYVEAINSLFLKETFKEKNKLEKGGYALGDEYNEKYIRARGGIFLMSLSRNLYPHIPVILYTESYDAFRESIPYQYANLYQLNMAGKEIQWEDYLIREAVNKIQSGAVSFAKINEAIINLKSFIDINFDRYNIPGVNEEKVTRTIDNFINFDIGKIEKGWTMGSFFILQLPYIASTNSIDVKTGIEHITDLLSKVDLTYSFTKFITYSSFAGFSHAHSDEFFSGPAENIKAIDAIKQPKLIGAQAKYLISEWKRTPCYHNEQVIDFEKRLVHVDELGETDNISEDILDELASIKEAIRWKSDGLIVYLINLIHKFSDKQNSISIEGFCVHERNNIMEIKKISKCNFPGERVFALPTKDLKDRDNNSMLNKIIVATIESIRQRGYNKTIDKSEHKINIYLEMDNINKRWKITICQVGGNFFKQTELRNKEYFVENKGELCRNIRNAKNWINILIRSNGWERNPHIFDDGREQNCLFEGSTTEFEYGIKYL